MYSDGDELSVVDCIWCLAANFQFTIMISNTRKVTEMVSSENFHRTDNLPLWIIQTVTLNFDEDELSVADYTVQ